MKYLMILMLSGCAVSSDNQPMITLGDVSAPCSANHMRLVNGAVWLEC